MAITKMSDLDLAGKRVLIREDLNVPVADGVVTSDARIRAALPTIRAALEANAIFGKQGPLTTIRGVITSGFVLTAVLWGALKYL